MNEFDEGPAGTKSGNDLSGTSGDRVLPIIDETLDVERRHVDRGGFRLTKTVVEREETVDELLVTSEFAVERHAIGRLVPPDCVPAVRIEGNTTIYPILKEVLITEKRMMLVAELHVRRSEMQYRDPQTFTLLQEDIVVEPIGDDRIRAVKQP